MLTFFGIYIFSKQKKATEIFSSFFLLSFFILSLLELTSSMFLYSRVTDGVTSDEISSLHLG